MDFYELCRSLRNKYQNQPNKEIELQILTQLFSAVFSNNDKFPASVTFDLDVKSLLKYGWPRPYEDLWQNFVASWPVEKRAMFWMKETLSYKIEQVLAEFGIKYVWIHYFSQKSAWKYSVEFGISPRYNLPLNK